LRECILPRGRDCGPRHLVPEIVAVPSRPVKLVHGHLSVGVWRDDLPVRATPRAARSSARTGCDHFHVQGILVYYRSVFRAKQRAGRCSASGWHSYTRSPPRTLAIAAAARLPPVAGPFQAIFRDQSVGARGSEGSYPGAEGPLRGLRCGPGLKKTRLANLAYRHDLEAFSAPPCTRSERRLEKRSRT